MNLNNAIVIVSPDSRPVVRKAAAVLKEEIHGRTGIRLAESGSLPEPAAPFIVLGEPHNHVTDPLPGAAIRHCPARGKIGY